jgi:hypothetical protein
MFKSNDLDKLQSLKFELQYTEIKTEIEENEKSEAERLSKVAPQAQEKIFQMYLALKEQEQKFLDTLRVSGYKPCHYGGSYEDMETCYVAGSHVDIFKQKAEMLSDDRLEVWMDSLPDGVIIHL